MVKLKSLSRVVPIHIKWNDDETLNLKVLPDRFTGAQLEAMTNAIKESDSEDVEQFRYMCKFMADLVQEWDLTDDDDKILEITPELIFNELPVTVVERLLREIQNALKVDPPKPEP